jgi:Ca2+-binding EF-hand superfamily protein
MSNSISSMASFLFAKIDTGSKGYLEKTDFDSAFSQLSSSGSTTSADQLFSTMDSNGDGKVTQDEMSAGIKKLAAALDSQFQSLRMAGAMEGGQGLPPPPPPPNNDAGFTKEELQSQLDSVGSSDAKRSALLSKTINNFSAADTNGDGKVSFQEAMAYDKANPTSTTSTNGNADTTTSTNAEDDLKLMLTILQLMKTYQSASSSDSTSALATTA